MPPGEVHTASCVGSSDAPQVTESISCGSTHARQQAYNSGMQATSATARKTLFRGVMAMSWWTPSSPRTAMKRGALYELLVYPATINMYQNVASTVTLVSFLFAQGSKGRRQRRKWLRKMALANDLRFIFAILCGHEFCGPPSGENDAQKEHASTGALVRLRGASRAPASAWYPARMCLSTRAPGIARRTSPLGATAENGAILADYWQVLSRFADFANTH